MTVRRRETVRFGIAFVWLLPLLFFGYFAVAPDTPGSQRVVYGVLAAVFAVLLIRTLRIGVATGGDGVVVRGVLRSWKVGWDDFEGFEMGRWRAWGSYPCGVVRAQPAVRAPAGPGPARARAARRAQRGARSDARATGKLKYVPGYGSSRSVKCHHSLE